MISVTLYTKEELTDFLKKEYKPGKSADDIIADSEREIREYFKDENKDSWMVIEYRGVPEKIPEHLSVFTVKYVPKYYLQIIIPQDAGMELPQKVMELVAGFNMGQSEVYILNMKYDRTLRENEVGFRLICPRYTYVDML